MKITACSKHRSRRASAPGAERNRLGGEGSSRDPAARRASGEEPGSFFPQAPGQGAFTWRVPTPAQKGAPLGALPSRDTDSDTDRDTGFSPGARRSGSCPVTKPLGKKWSLGLERWTETASEITDKRQARDSGAVDGARARASHYRPSAWGTPEPSDPRPT